MADGREVAVIGAHGEMPETGQGLSRTYLKVEYAALFFAVPGLFALRLFEIPAMLVVLLYSATLVSGVMLLRDRTFDRSLMWNREGVKRGLAGAVTLWLVGVVVLGSMMYFLRPELFLTFPREKPLVWLAVMVLYPVFSVYPQNIIYRAFIFQRYRELFTTPGSMVWGSAAAFSFAHVIFQNWIALLITLTGGLIFAGTYQKHRSLLLCSIEHALYGCLVFTIGMGSAIYLPR